MVNWNGVDADVNVWLNKHYTAGRNGASIKHIVIHHNGGVLTTQDCYNVWQSREASAHYQVEKSGRIGQLVHDWDTAWHAGSWAENVQSIGIEHSNSGGADQGWPISNETREAGAHLVAALCKRYSLGRPQWGVNVFPHKHFSSTDCPGQLYSTYRDSYIQRAQEWYDQMTGSTPAPAPAPARTYTDITALQRAVRATADNISGPDTRKRIDAVRKASTWGGTKFPYGVAYTQQVVGTTADGVWGKNSRAAHDNTVAAIQRAVGATVDSIWGNETEAKVNDALNGAEQS